MNQFIEYMMVVVMMGFLGGMVRSMVGPPKSKTPESKALVPYKSQYYQTLITKATPMMTGTEEPYATAIGKPIREVVYIPLEKPIEVPRREVEPVKEPVKVPVRSWLRR